MVAQRATKEIRDLSGPALVKVNITYFKVKSLESAGKGSDLLSSLVTC